MKGLLKSLHIQTNLPKQLHSSPFNKLNVVLDLYLIPYFTEARNIPFVKSIYYLFVLGFFFFSGIKKFKDFSGAPTPI